MISVNQPMLLDHRPKWHTVYAYKPSLYRATGSSSASSTPGVPELDGGVLSSDDSEAVVSGVEAEDAESEAREVVEVDVASRAGAKVGAGESGWSCFGKAGDGADKCVAASSSAIESG